MFTQTAAFASLQALSKRPIDLTDPRILTADRISRYAVKGLGFDLLYGTERVDDEVMHALLQLAQESKALAKMRAMQSGEVINKIEGFECEHRSVLHTAMRDVFERRETAPMAKKASDLALKELDKLEKFLEKIDGHYTDLIQIGIGGSDLGPRALCVALEAFHKPNRKIHFISNVDPDDANAVLKQIDNYLGGSGFQIGHDARNIDE